MRCLAVLGVALVLSACAEPSLTALEYRNLATERAAAYAQEAEDLRLVHLSQLETAVDRLVRDLEGEALEAAAVEETARRSAALFAAVTDAVDRYVVDLAALDPPGGLRDPHDEYVAALVLSIDGMGATLEALAVATTFTEIDEAIGGSAFNDAQHRVDAACLGLEQALRDELVGGDLHCRDQ